MPKTPNENKKLKLSEKFNVQLKQHLSRLGWTDPEQQNRFVALMNSFILSGKSTSAQRIINNYLDKGLDVLNIELKRIEITKDNSIVQVDPDEVEDTQEIQQEAISKKEFDSILREGRRKNLSTANILKEELQVNPNATKIMTKLIENDGNKQLAEQVINHMLSKRVIMEQGSVNSNNFRVFLNNYLTSDKGWVSGSIESLITGVIKLVEKGAGDINAQKDIIRELDIMIDNMSKVVDIKSAQETKNSKTAFSELSIFASKLRGWSSEFYSEFISQIMKIIGTARSPKLQNFVSNKVGDLHNKIKADEPKEQEPKKPEEPKQEPKQKEPAPKPKDKNIKEAQKTKKDPFQAFDDDYGVELTKARNKIIEMQRNSEDFPEEMGEDFLTEMEQVYDPEIVEKIFFMVVEDSGVQEYDLFKVISNKGLQGIEDMFDFINDLYEKFKETGAV